MIHSNLSSYHNQYSLSFYHNRCSKDQNTMKRSAGRHLRMNQCRFNHGEVNTDVTVFLRIFRKDLLPKSISCPYPLQRRVEPALPGLH